jgi:hypothetical protein
LTSGILVTFLAALEILPGLILLGLPLLLDAELLLDGLLTLLDLFRMLLRVLLGVILQLVELAHDAPPVPMSGSPGLSARGHSLPDAGGTTPAGSDARDRRAPTGLQVPLAPQSASADVLGD